MLDASFWHFQASKFGMRPGENKFHINLFYPLWLANSANHLQCQEIFICSNEKHTLCLRSPIWQYPAKISNEMFFILGKIWHFCSLFSKILHTLKRTYPVNSTAVVYLMNYSCLLSVLWTFHIQAGAVTRQPKMRWSFHWVAVRSWVRSLAGAFSQFQWIDQGTLGCRVTASQCTRM